MNRRSRLVLVAAIMTYVGAAFLAIGGVTFLLLAGPGRPLGGPGDIAIAGARFLAESTSLAGIVMIVLGLLLVLLAVFAQRGYPAGRFGLTGIGVLVVAWLVSVVLTADPVSPLVPILWIAATLVLLWIGHARTVRPARGAPAPAQWR